MQEDENNKERRKEKGKKTKITSRSQEVIFSWCA